MSLHKWLHAPHGTGLLYVRRAKGGRQRVMPIHPALVSLFVDYYATRVPLTEQAVFVGIQEQGAGRCQAGDLDRVQAGAGIVADSVAQSAVAATVRD